MDRFENPYRPGAGSAPPTLIGRDELIDNFEITVRRALDRRPGKSCIAIGLRGVGKTVLLNRFMAVAADQGMRSGFIEASETSDFGELLASRIRRILLELNEGKDVIRRAVELAIRVLSSFTTTHTLPTGSSIKVGVKPLPGRADSGLLADDLTDLLAAVGEAASACDSGLLLAVDELQYLEESELAGLIAAIHRTTQLDLPVVLAGAGLPQLPGQLGKARSYAERLFELPEIGKLDPDDAAKAIDCPARALGVRFEPAGVELIVAESQGYPYFLQEWGYHTWNAAPADPITGNDVHAARADVIDKLDRDFFRVRYDRLTRKEREYLQAMAEIGPGPHRSGDIAAELGVQVNSVAPRRSGLISKGVIYSPAHGETAFTVPLFDNFLKRTDRGRRT